MNKLIPLAAIIALSASAAHASSIEVRSETVRYADLDVNTVAGAAVLFTRIKNASQHVCRDFDSRSLSMKQHYRNCIDTALNAAVKHVDRPEFTAYAWTRGVRPAYTLAEVASNRK